MSNQVGSYQSLIPGRHSRTKLASHERFPDGGSCNFDVPCSLGRDYVDGRLRAIDFWFARTISGSLDHDISLPLRSCRGANRRPRNMATRNATGPGCEFVCSRELRRSHWFRMPTHDLAFCQLLHDLQQLWGRCRPGRRLILECYREQRG